MTDMPMSAAQVAQQNNRDSGGKYATKEHPEADVALTDAESNDPKAQARLLYGDLVAEGSVSTDFDTWYAQGLDLQWRYGNEVEGLERLSVENVAMLRVLIDPANDPSERDPEELLYEFEAFEAFEDGNGYMQYRDVGDIVARSYPVEDDAFVGAGMASFDLPDDDGSGEPPYYTVSVRLGEKHRNMKFADSDSAKYLADGDVSCSGIEAACRAARMIDGDLLRVRQTAADAGLLPRDLVERRTQ